MSISSRTAGAAFWVAFTVGPAALSAQSPGEVGVPVSGSAEVVPGQQGESEVGREARYKLGVGYAFFYFDEDFDPWHVGQASVERKDNSVALIARANYAYRFEESAIQFEADAYPFFTRNVYGYLNVGYSPSESFPEWRFGGDLWANLPGAWETSLGGRYLLFPDEEIPMLTGSVGKYYGNYWTSLRPFIVFAGSDVTWALALVTRRYYVDADNYVSFLASYGDAPDPRISEAELDRLNNLQVEIGGKHPLSAQVSWGWALAYQWEELTGDRGRNRLGFRLSFEHRK